MRRSCSEVPAGIGSSRLIGLQTSILLLCDSDASAVCRLIYRPLSVPSQCKWDLATGDLCPRTCDAVGTAAVADGQNLFFATHHIALVDCRSSARPWIIPPRRRITQLQSLDDCCRTSPVEELGKKLVATINNIDHEQFHFIIAKAPEALP